MSLPLDFYEDLPDLNIYRGLGDVPPLVKQAQALDPAVRAALPDRCFALVVEPARGRPQRFYPLTDPAHVWLADRYFAKTGHQLPPLAGRIAASRILKAAHQIGLPVTPTTRAWGDAPLATNRYQARADRYSRPGPSVGQLRKLAALPVEAVTAAFAATHDPTQYGLAFQEPDGCLVLRYPLRTREEVAQGQAYFAKHAAALPVAERVAFGAALARRLAECGLPIGGLDKYAHPVYRSDAGTAVRARAHLAPPPQQACYHELADKLPALSIKTAMVLLEALDRETGVWRGWQRQVADPFDTLAKAAEEPVLETVGGMAVTPSLLRALVDQHYEQIVEQFGPEIAEALQGDPGTIFPSLPAPTQAALLELLAA